MFRPRAHKLRDVTLNWSATALMDFSASALPALANSPRAGRGARCSRRKMAAAFELDRLFRGALTEVTVGF